jgi:hypothetical protein
MKVYLIKHPGNGWWWNDSRICFTQSPNGGTQYKTEEEAISIIMEEEALDGIYEIIQMWRA